MWVFLLFQTISEHILSVLENMEPYSLGLTLLRFVNLPYLFQAIEGVRNTLQWWSGQKASILAFANIVFDTEQKYPCRIHVVA